MKAAQRIARGAAVVGLAAAAQPAAPAPVGHADTAVHYRTARVDGLDIFYREAGPADGKVVLLLHGFPTSSHMFRNLIPALADRYHVVAPDYPGFGHSSMPTVDQFQYNFDHLAEVVDHFTQVVGARRYTIFAQDYGAPVGFRLAAAHPERIEGIIIQNGNAYAEGLGDGIKPLLDYGREPTPERERALRGLLTPDITRFQYVHGVNDPTRVDPDNWAHDQALLDRPGNAEIQLALFKDYRNNAKLYPAWQQYFRTHRPPMLIAWGKNDPFFAVEGAKAYARDNPNAELHVLDTGHFALEDQLAEVTTLVRDFLASRVERTDGK